MREGTDSEAFSRGHGSSSKSWGERKVYLSINIILPSLSSVGENSMTNISKPKSETEKLCSKTGQSFLPREAGMERWKQIQTVHLNLALCAHSCMKAFTSIAQFANVSMQTICSLRELLRLIWSVHLFCCYKASYIRNQHTSSVCWGSHGESRACNVLRFPLKAFSNTHIWFPSLCDVHTYITSEDFIPHQTAKQPGQWAEVSWPLSWVALQLLQNLVMRRMDKLHILVCWSHPEGGA